MSCEKLVFRHKRPFFAIVSSTCCYVEKDLNQAQSYLLLVYKYCPSFSLFHLFLQYFCDDSIYIDLYICRDERGPGTVKNKSKHNTISNALRLLFSRCD